MGLMVVKCFNIMKTIDVVMVENNYNINYIHVLASRP